MTPFDQYPGGGRRLLGTLSYDSSRNALAPALEMQFITGQTRCAYCGGSLFGEYSCSLPRLDLVVPPADADRLGIPREYSCDIINTVLCCSSCYELTRALTIPDDLRPREVSVEAFTSLRDNIYEERKALVAQPEAEQQTSVVPLDLWDLPAAA